jgi:hypothetical protein
MSKFVSKFASKGNPSVYQQAKKNNLALIEAKSDQEQKLEIFIKHILV